MGFLSGLSGILGGGSQASSNANSASGFALLPPQIQEAYTNYANAVKAQIPNAASAYTPMPLTAGENAALGNLTNGFTPTQASLSSDVGMLMNPFNDSVIQQINRQANGDNSILKQTMDQFGTYGSNRQLLGANDIENSRQATIGSLLQGQYNQALGQVFNNLIPQRQQDASNALAAGTYQRNIANQTSQAPIFGLQQVGTALGVLPSNGGSVSNSSSQSSQSGTGTFGNLLSTAGTIASLFSDVRLKENIVPMGSENGHNIYEFSYKDDPRRYIGVIAQEVEDIAPDAVEEISGYKAVNYHKIGVRFREVA